MKSQQNWLKEIFEKQLVKVNLDGKAPSIQIDEIIQEYMLKLNLEKIFIPTEFRPILIEELKEEIRELTIQLTFGKVKSGVEDTNSPKLSQYVSVRRRRDS